jgi:hypothetical protein
MPRAIVAPHHRQTCHAAVIDVTDDGRSVFAKGAVARLS